MASITVTGVTAAGATGLPAVIVLVALSEAAGPVPVPTDLLLLALGERVQAGSVPLWLAIVGLELAVVVGTSALYVLCRRPARRIITRFGAKVGLTEARLAQASALVERRGLGAVALGRATPGLRTVTVLAVSGSNLPARPALTALVIGSTAFAQAHLALGYLLGPAARSLIHDNALVLVAVLALIAAVGLVVWFVVLGRRRGARAWREAACPACLAIGLAARQAHERDD